MVTQVKRWIYCAQGKDGQIPGNRYLTYNRGRWAENRLDKERSLPWEKGSTDNMWKEYSTAQCTYWR